MIIEFKTCTGIVLHLMIKLTAAMEAKPVSVVSCCLLEISDEIMAS